jgi:hypothetical protein
MALLKRIFESYRANVPTTPNKKQIILITLYFCDLRMLNLVMATKLKASPTYALGMLKSTVFTARTSFDERGHLLFPMAACFLSPTM